MSCLVQRGFWLLLCFSAAGCQAGADQAIVEQAAEMQSSGSVAAAPKVDRDRLAAQMRAEYEQIRQHYQEELRRVNQGAEQRFEMRLASRKLRNEVQLRLLQEIEHATGELTRDEIQAEKGRTIKLFRQREQNILEQQLREETMRRAPLEQRLEEMRSVSRRLKSLYQKSASPSDGAHRRSIESEFLAIPV